MTSDYGNHFIKAWQQTPNYQLWNDFVDWELLNEIVVPGHPCQGNFSLAHVQRRLAKYESIIAIVFAAQFTNHSVSLLLTRLDMCALGK